MSQLSNGQPFPKLQVPAVDGGTMSLPDDLAGRFGVVLAYRGSWCPYCNAQLASFQRASQTLDELDIAVAALSVDDEETTRELIDKHHLSFAFGHSIDVDEVAEATGAYVNQDPDDPRRYLQSTGFVLAPDGTLITAVYSSGAIGRLVADDVIGLVRYIREHN
jgi:peroxiredoxin